ncbi:MAG: nucleoside diphosphate kinase regulator, partial [Bacillota bacterium]
MTERTISLTEFDRRRLSELVHVARSFSSRDQNHLRQLRIELDRAETVVDPSRIPPDVVTMNSKVRVRDIDSGEEMVYTLVFPADADLEEHRISVLAPIGTAILGYRVGDVVEWPVPAGVRRLKIQEI